MPTPCSSSPVSAVVTPLPGGGSETLAASAATSTAHLRVSVLSAEGIPDGSVLSVRAGGFRRQRPLSRFADPFVFRSALGAAQPLQVDVLVAQASTGDLGILGDGDHEVRFRAASSACGTGPCPGGLDPSAVRMTLRVAEVRSPSPSCVPDPESTSPKAGCGSATAAAQQYMEEHLLKDRLTHALMQLLREQPDNPMHFLARVLDGSRDGMNTSNKPVPEVSATTKPVAGQLSLRRNRESVHVLPPCVVRGAPTRLLDFGSGETGFNVYQMDAQGRLNYRGNKRKEPFFASFVEPRRLEAFCDALNEEFNLVEETQGWADVTIFAGATGLHRELMDNAEAVQKALTFLEDAEYLLSAKLDGRPTKLWLFVPSGLLEAQFELYATEWLVSRGPLLDFGSIPGPDSDLKQSLLRSAFAQMDHTGDGTLSDRDLEGLLTAPTGRNTNVLIGAMNELGVNNRQIEFADFQEALAVSPSLRMAVQAMVFSGTISAGGGSSQLAMMNGHHGSTLQLFSVPVGNRVPIVESLFSKPVLAGERDMWASRIRSTLGQTSFPRGVRGLYVGISAVYHAVKAAGLTDQVVGKQAVLAGLQAALVRVDPDNQRDIANLMLVHEVLDWVFDHTACFVFKREWKLDDGEFVATWTLGLYTQQHRSLKAEESSTVSSGNLWKVAAARLNAPLAASQTLRMTANSPGRNARTEALFEVPFVAWPFVATHLLDIGSGEVGCYIYESDLIKRLVVPLHDAKIQEPFFEGFVAKGRVTDFASLLIQEFSLEPNQKFPRREVIAGGATGLHRELLLSDQERRDKMFAFVSQVEAEMEARIGRPTCIRLFVPSGELEAQFELRAVEWLIGLPSVDIQAHSVDAWMLEKAWSLLIAAESEDGGGAKAKQARIGAARARLTSLGIHEADVHEALRHADTNCNSMLDYREFAAAVSSEVSLLALVRKLCFAGTISAGGGSSQLTLVGCMRNSMPQLYSMPIGNRLPIVQRLFSDRVTWEQRSDWVARLRDALRSSQFPQGVTGFFVGISAMYYAAKSAGIADQIVTKREAVAALANALARLDAADHRSVANLTLVKEIITWVFHDERSCLLFKRKWSNGPTTYVAGWTLGWYTTQFEGDAEVREQSVRTIQRIERGRQARRAQKLRRIKVLL